MEGKREVEGGEVSWRRDGCGVGLKENDKFAVIMISGRAMAALGVAGSLPWVDVPLQECNALGLYHQSLYSRSRVYSTRYSVLALGCTQVF